MLFSRARRRTSGELRTFEPAVSAGCAAEAGAAVRRSSRGRRCRRLGGFRLSRRGRRLGRFALGRRGRRGGGGSAIGVDHSHDGLDGHRLAFGDFDFLEHASGRRRNFRIHLVGGDFKERLVAVDLVAGLLQPLGDRAFKNAFAHLGHDDVDSHGVLLGVETQTALRHSSCHTPGIPSSA